MHKIASDPAKYALFVGARMDGGDHAVLDGDDPVGVRETSSDGSGIEEKDLP